MSKPIHTLVGDGDGFSRLKIEELFYKLNPYSTAPSVWPAGSNANTRNDYAASSTYKLIYTLNVDSNHSDNSVNIGLGADSYSGQHVVCDSITDYNNLADGEIGVLVNELTGDDYENTVKFFWRYDGFDSLGSAHGASIPAQRFTTMNFTAAPPFAGNNSDLSLHKIGGEKGDVIGISPYSTGYLLGKNPTDGTEYNTFNNDRTNTGDSSYGATLPGPGDDFKYYDVDVVHYHPSYLLLDVYDSTESSATNYSRSDCIGRTFYGTLLRVFSDVQDDTRLFFGDATNTRTQIYDRIGQTMPKNTTYGRQFSDADNEVSVQIITLGGLKFFHSRYKSKPSGEDGYASDGTTNDFANEFASLRTFS